jgi:hypothetical protein
MARQSTRAPSSILHGRNELPSALADFVPCHVSLVTFQYLAGRLEMLPFCVLQIASVGD